MADAGSVTQVLEAMQGAAAQASAVFVPEGLYLARLLIAISLVWFCVDCFHGRESWVGGGLRLCRDRRRHAVGRSRTGRT